MHQRRSERRAVSRRDGHVTRPLLGAHVSIAGGVSEALIRGRDTGCECVQIFTKSSRQWVSKPFPKEEVENFKRALGETGIKMVIAHDSYLINMGAPDDSMRKKSVAGFIDELERCEMLGVPFLIAHPGSHVGAGEETGIKTIANRLNEAHQACAGFKVRNRARNNRRARQQPRLQVRADESDLRCHPSNERMRLCFDTEHAFAAGYDLRDDEVTNAPSPSWMNTSDSIGWWHFTSTTRSSRFIRASIAMSISQGLSRPRPIPPSGHDARFAGIPMCLETEPGPEMKDITADLQQLRQLLKSAN